MVIFLIKLFYMNKKEYIFNFYKNFIFENDNFIILNKPYNIPVHGGTKVDYSIIDFLKHYSYYKNGYIELVHRLDKDTSGCLILAKNKIFLRKFHILLQSNLVEKEYHALIKGKINILFNSTFSNYQLNNYNVKIKKSYIDSINYYSIIKEYEKFSIIKIFPITGKMHQIRIHLSYIGNPIAGDVKYGSKKFNFYLKSIQLDRMFLHFTSIKFKCPIDNKLYFIKAEYDESLIKFINNLKGNFNAK